MLLPVPATPISATIWMWSEETSANLVQIFHQPVYYVLLPQLATATPPKDNTEITTEPANNAPQPTEATASSAIPIPAPATQL